MNKYHAEYGYEARVLKQSSFFRTPKVWQAIDTNENFIGWIKSCECVGPDSESKTKCNGDIVAAHVQNIKGSRIKSKYSAIPLCTSHYKIMRYTQIRYTQQSQKEKSDFYIVKYPEDVKIFGMSWEGWFDKKRIRCVSEWAWETLKKSLGFDSWKEVPPEFLKNWAKLNHVDNYLPKIYRCNKL